MEQQSEMKQFTLGRDEICIKKLDGVGVDYYISYRIVTKNCYVVSLRSKYQTGSKATSRGISRSQGQPFIKFLKHLSLQETKYLRKLVRLMLYVSLETL